MDEEPEQVASPALKAFWFQVAAEAFALSGRVDAALDALDEAVAHVGVVDDLGQTRDL